MPTAREAPTTVAAAPGGRRWARVPAVPCRHVASSHKLILDAAGAVTGDDAIVLGAGRCQEIPLAPLADRFPRLTLNDHDAALLDEALASSGLAADRRAAVTTLDADLTGVTAAFLAEVDAVLGGPAETGSGTWNARVPDPVSAVSAADLTPETAAARLADLAAAVRPVPFATGRRYDLVVASCVLCQLHLSAWNRTLDRFAARFPGRAAVLQRSPAWFRSMYDLARRLDRAFIDTLYDLAAPAGRVYFSDTVQCALLYPDPAGVGPGWLSDGFLRMTRTTELADELDARFAVVSAGRWHWVMDPAAQAGGVGRLYRVQGFVLSTQRP